RFKIETTTLKSKFFFIKEGKDNRVEMVTTEAEPLLIVKTGKGQLVRNAKFKVNNLVEVMGWKAAGAKLTEYSKTIEMEWEKKEVTDNPQPELF
ncbi:MAG: DNA gyrase/topoisomerase IV subunit A, partial [Ferruginibacter sp.]|nr:DNA gyrase/topoisomerase IV subunit A [Ferruginibacter sp.]